VVGNNKGLLLLSLDSSTFVGDDHQQTLCLITHHFVHLSSVITVHTAHQLPTAFLQRIVLKGTNIIIE
jgi:hypothetical protein